MGKIYFFVLGLSGAACLHARFPSLVQKPGQMVPVALQAFFKERQKLVGGVCEVTVRRKARYDLALADDVFLPLTDMALDHLDLGFFAADHLNLLLPYPVRPA